MIKRTLEELTTYEAPGHVGCCAMRVHGKDETGATKFWIGRSTFLPGGGAEYQYEDNPLEKVYYVLEGEITVIDKQGTVYTMHKDEAICFPPNEGRTLENRSNRPAIMLVVINYPDATGPRA